MNRNYSKAISCVMVLAFIVVNVFGFPITGAESAYSADLFFSPVQWTPSGSGQTKIIARLTEMQDVTTVTELSTTVLVITPIDKKVLVDQYHGNADVPGTVGNFVNLLRTYGYSAHFNDQPFTSQSLSGVDVLVLGDSGIRFNDDNGYEPEDSDNYAGGMVWSVYARTFPEAPSGLNENTEEFEGEKELCYQDFTYDVLYVGPAKLVAPEAIATADVADGQLAGKLVVTSGTVTEVNEPASYFKIDDGSGEAYIHVDGCLGIDIAGLTTGDLVSVTGIASYGAAGPRIRVRYPADIRTGGLSQATIAVFADPHYFDPDLGTTGEAFDEYLANDRKLIAESSAIAEKVVELVKESSAGIVLVPGDLTKDGELTSHQKFAELLKELEEAGKDVYVINGNHDINNPHAHSYSGSQTNDVANVSPEQFKEIYRDFGYLEATAQDPNSLSYVVEPSDGLRIIAMDSAVYDNNIADGRPHTEGAFTEDTLNWITEQAKEGVARGQTVIGMMHHGLIEHFTVQRQFFPEFIINDADEIAAELANAGMKAVFTGHFHVQDIVQKQVGENVIYDIETGSLVTYPCPYRLVELTEAGKLIITTKTVEEVNYDTGGKDFPVYAQEFLMEGIDDLVPNMLAGVLIARGVPQEEAFVQANQICETVVAPDLTVKDLIVTAMMEHYQGDESIDPDLLPVFQGMAASEDEMQKMLGQFLLSLASDPVPPDNTATVDISTGNDGKPFIIVPGKLDKTAGIKATVTVERSSAADHDGNELVVFQLMKNATPLNPRSADDIKKQEQVSTPKNVILLIGDGMGFEQVEAARDEKGSALYMDSVDDALDFQAANPDTLIIVTADLPEQLVVQWDEENHEFKVTSMGAEVAGAEVKLDGQTVGTTDAAGKVSYTGNSGTFEVTATKDGYITSEARDIEIAGQPAGWELTVMHTNDTHGYLAEVDGEDPDGYSKDAANIAKRGTAIANIRAEAANNLLLDAGDVFSGALYFTKNKGDASVEFMNMLGYDAMTLGNHEFDYGPELLRDFIEQAGFPVVNANLDFSSETALSDIANNTVGEEGQDTLNGQIYPAIILDVNGEQVGIIGLDTEDLKELSSPGDNIVINNAVNAAKSAVASLEDKGVNKIIAVTHLGWNNDVELAEAVEGIDIIVGGHSHTIPDTYPTVVTDTVNNTPTVVVQAGEHGELLGRLDVVFNDHGLVTYQEGSLLNVSEYIEDATVAARLADYSKEITGYMETVVGQTAVELDGVRENVRSKETNLGNLIADGMLDKASELCGATLAITNGGGIRASIDQGDITLGEVLTVMPYGNTLTALELTGEQIVAALENGVSQVENGAGRFPHVAGMRFTWDPGQEPGSRIVSVEIAKENGFEPIDRQASYWVATNNYMAGGGDGYEIFTQASDRLDLGFVDYEVFNEYLAENSPVSPQVEGRIKTGLSESKPFIIETDGYLDRTAGLKATVNVDPTSQPDHEGNEVM